MKPVVRLKSLEINNIKNVQRGRITMPDAYRTPVNADEGSVLGLYGQNGSGKTSVINALYFLKILMAGQSLPEEFENYADVDASDASIKAYFYLFRENKEDPKEERNEDSENPVEASDSQILGLEYTAFFKRAENGLYLDSESLSGEIVLENGTTRKNPILEVVHGEEELELRPKKKLNDLLRDNKRNRTEIPVALRMSEKDKKSFLFSDHALEVFGNVSPETDPDLSFILNTLNSYAKNQVYIILNRRTDQQRTHFPRLSYDEENGLQTTEELMISVTSPRVYSLEEKEEVEQWAVRINIVLNYIIPGMQIMINDLGRQTMNDGREGVRLELLSKKEDGPAIPLSRESEGIIKIISVLNALIRAYSDPSVLVAIDELDAGVYEYMLGELMDIFEGSGAGQLLFTSHNLRALEMLDENSVMFSTTNPKNRYIRMRKGKQKNMRDAYLRSITLGGQEEPVYQETDSLKIARAFRKASRSVDK